MHFVKVVDGSGESRWINLARVSRATLATDSRNNQILVLLFEDPEARFELSSADKAERQAIDVIIAELDKIAAHEGTGAGG